MSQWALIPNNLTPPDVVTSPSGCKGWQNVWFIFASDLESNQLHQIGFIYQERIREYHWKFLDAKECPPALRGLASTESGVDLAHAIQSAELRLTVAKVEALRRGLS